MNKLNTKKMTRMKANIFSLVLITAALLQACTEEMNIPLDSTYKRLVVDGEITTDTTSHCIHLAESADYYYNKPLEGVSNAVVTVTDGTNTYEFTESTANPGYYYSQPDVYGIPGRTYTLTVKNVDIDKNGVPETYTANCYMPVVEKADSIKVLKSNTSFYDYDVMYFGPEPGETADYYYFRLRRNGVLVTDTLTESMPSNDEFYNGHYLKNISVYKLQKGKTDEDIKAGDTLTIENCGISKEYNDFLTDVQLQAHGADPFGGQPANISTNVEDKKKTAGFFAAYSIARISYIVKETDLNK